MAAAAAAGICSGDGCFFSLYIYYTATTPEVHNRVTRFTANGNGTVPGSETIILDLDNLSGAQNHNGGAIVGRRKCF